MEMWHNGENVSGATNAAGATKLSEGFITFAPLASVSFHRTNT